MEPDADGVMGGDEDHRQNDEHQSSTSGSGKKRQTAAKHDSGAADLEKVTDFEEEREISSQDLAGAMNIIGERKQKEMAEKIAKQRELAQVKINKQDLELIIKEMEIPRTKAEVKLKECGGDVVEALRQLVNL